MKYLKFLKSLVDSKRILIYGNLTNIEFSFSPKMRTLLILARLRNSVPFFYELN